MIPQLRSYLLDNWADLPVGRQHKRPRRLEFLVQATGISKLCCYIFADDEDHPRWVAKMPRTPRDNGILAHEYGVTEHLRTTGNAYVRLTIAAPLFTTTIADHLVGIEPYLAGRPMDGLMSTASDQNAPEILKNLEISIDWLLRCQQSTGSKAERPSAAEIENCLRSISFMKATSRLTASEAAYLDRLSAQFTQLAGVPLPLTFKHGDFQPGNILVDGSAIHVIDWEFGAISQLPLHDVFGFIARTYARYRGLEEMDEQLDEYLADFETVFFEGGSFTGPTLKYVAQACEALGVDRAWVKTLFGLFVVNEANKYNILLSRRAERGYVYLLGTKDGGEQHSYVEQLARQKQVHLLGYLAEHEDRLIFRDVEAHFETPHQNKHRVTVGVRQ
ncbi:MAG: phosphotransferase [Chloroflexota bacterium]